MALLLLILLTSPPTQYTIELDSNSPRIYSIYQNSIIKTPKYDSDYLLIVENQNLDTTGSIFTNEETIKSASWMGVYGNYFIFIPKNSANTITVRPFQSTVKSTEVKLTLISIDNYSMRLKSALKLHVKANNLRVNDYLDGTNNSSLAIDYFASAESIFSDEKMSFLSAVSSFEKAVVLHNNDFLPEAIDSYEQSIAYWGISHNDLQIYRIYNRLGLVYWKLNQLDKAENYFSLIINSTKPIENIIIKSQALSNLGLIYRNEGKMSKAIEAFTNALKLNGVDLDYSSIPLDKLTKVFSQHQNLKNIIATLNNLALSYNATGNSLLAEKLLMAYLDLSSNLNNNTRAKAKNNLSTLLIKKGNYYQAIHYLQEALSIFNQSKNNRWQSLTEHNLAKTYKYLGLNQLAIIHIHKAIQLRKSKNDYKGIVESNTQLIEININQNSFEEAEILINENLQLAIEHNLYKEIAKISISKFKLNLNNLNYGQAEKDIVYAMKAIDSTSYKRLYTKLVIHKAELYISQHKYKGAINILISEVENLKTTWDTTLLNKANNLLAQAYIKNKQLYNAEKTILNEVNNLRFYISSSASDKIRDNLSLMLKETLGIYNTISLLQNKSINGFIKTNQMLSSFLHYDKQGVQESNLSLVKVNELLGNIKSKSLALENSKLSSDDRKQIQNNIIELKSELDFSYLASKQIAEEKINIQTIQNSLDEDSLIIQFSIGEAGGVSWWISKHKFESYVLRNKKDLTELINLAHDEFTQKTQSYQSIKKLSNELLKPLSNYKDIKNIQLVLDEPLNLIPFNALLDPRFKKKQVLAENVLVKRFSSINSLSLAQDFMKPNPQDMSMLIIADPVTSVNDARLVNKVDEESSLPYKRLMGTQKEAENIGKLFNAETLQGFDANKESLINSDLKNKMIIHLATHAFFHPEIPGLSSIVLSNYKATGSNTPSAYLRALDISEMDIKAELVVLSGCETGLNHYDNSLGLGGLTQSFMQAGAKNLIASLWKVNDKVTEKMMTEFYRGYKNGLSIDQALAQAQKLIRTTPRTSHPKYWAGWFLLTQ